MAEVTTNIDSKTGARVHVVTGELTPEDLLAVLGETYERPDYKPGACVVWDLRDAKLHLFDKHDIRKIADYVTGHRNAPTGTCAALVVGRTVDYGLSRMYEQMLLASTDARVKVFWDMEEARAWLKSGAKEKACP